MDDCSTDEDRLDAVDAAKALAEPGESIPAEDLWVELGLDDDATGTRPADCQP